MPCLDEANTILDCIGNAEKWLLTNNISGEIIIADNGSMDGSKEKAAKKAVRIIDITDKGYGSALLGGIGTAKGKYIIMGDADGSYDFSALDPFLEKLREGYDLVLGNRFSGGIEPGAMPLLNRRLGNPVLSKIGQTLFDVPCRDFHCGLRAFNNQSFKGLKLEAQGMEFASEMVAKAGLAKLKITEVPTRLYKDGRTRRPHLRPLRDGWRHLHLMFRLYFFGS